MRRILARSELMYIARKQLILGLVCGVVFWVVDALLDFLFFYEGSLLDLLILQVPSHEIYIRLAVFVGFAVFGIHLGRLLAERKQIEDDLIKGQRRLLEFQAIAELGSWELDLVENELWWSDEVYRIFGVDPESFGATYEAFLGFVHPDDQELVNTAYTRSVEKNIPYEVIHRVVRPDGTIRVVRERSEEIKDESGKAIRSIGTVHDITEIERSAEEAKQSRRRFDQLLESISDGVLVLDTDWQYLLLNDQIVNMTGFSRGKLLGRKMSDVFPDIVESDFGRMCEEVFKTGETGVNIQHWTYEDGRNAWYESRAYRVPEGILVIMSDITQRKCAEEALIESEQKYRSLFEHANDAIIILDPEDETVLEVNSRASELYGYPREVFIGKSFKELTKDVERGEAQIQDLLEQGTQANFESIHFNRQGRELQIVTNSAVINYDGRPAILDVSRDVTEERALQTRAHHSQRLEAIGRLAGGIAHDFNNVLTVILGNTELSLAMLKKDEPLHERIKTIQKAGNHAAGLTKKLLAFGRRQIVEPRVLNLNTVLDDSFPMLRRLIPENVELVSKLDEKLDSVRIDPGQVEQVLVNLVVNAADATPKGGSITIETRLVDLDRGYVASHPYTNEGPHVMLAVSDTGAGIEDDVLAHIFEPFYSTKAEGSGLGLATVYGIAKQNGGSVEAYSEVGVGTTFKVYLPVVDAIIESCQKDEILVEDFTGVETILVVEDDKGVREYVAEVLHKHGYTVHSYANPSEARGFSESFYGTIDLLLTDVVMPGESGKELHEYLSDIRQSMRVLFMSGYTDNAIVEYGILDEGIEFLQKPISVHSLLVKVRQVLDAGTGT